MSIKLLTTNVLGLCAMLASVPVMADSNTVVLTVTGKISRFTDAGKKVYEFREKDLMAMKQYSITTKTNWTPTSVFTGPLFRDILSKVGAMGEKAKFVAINDYAYTIDVSDFSEYAAVLAHSLNGKRLDVANRGPLWLMYPLQSMPDELKGPDLDAKLIWQVDRIVIR